MRRLILFLACAFSCVVLIESYEPNFSFPFQQTNGLSNEQKKIEDIGKNVIRIVRNFLSDLQLSRRNHRQGVNSVSPIIIVGMVGKRYESYVARTDLVTCKFQVLLAAVLSISIFALIFLRYKKR